MAVYYLKNCRFYHHGYNLSSIKNKAELGINVDMLDATVFGCNTKISAAGLTEVTFNCSGFLNNETINIGDIPDSILFQQLGVENKILSICPTSDIVGEKGFAFKSIKSEYNSLGNVGELTPFTCNIKGTGPPVRGTILESAITEKSVTGNGTAINLGAVTSAQELYGVFSNVKFSGTSPTLTVKIQSDDSEAFASPIDRITFTAIGGLFTAEWKEASGPITDTWWRASWTTGGTTPKFWFQVLLAIQ